MTRILILILLFDLLPGTLVPGGIGAPWFGEHTADASAAVINAPFTVDPQFSPWVTDGDGAIHSAVVQPDGKTILAGEFSYLNSGRPTSGIARLHANGSLDTGFMNGQLGSGSAVRAAALQADGKVLVGGYFTTMNGVQRSMLARLNVNGSLDTGFLNGAAGLNDAAFAIAVQPDGKIIVGGQFTMVNGVQRNRLVRLNSDGSVDTGFLNGLTGPNAAVRSIVLLPFGQILIGGSFTNVSGASRGGLARLNSDGTVDTGYLAGFHVFGSTINSVCLQADGRILIGGDFTNVLGQTYRRIARLTAEGAIDSFNSLGVDSTVNTISAQPDGKILVGGAFTVAGTVPYRRIARLHADGTPDLTYIGGAIGANNSVLALAPLADGRTIAAGSFTDFNGNSRALVSRLNTLGQPDSEVNQPFSGMIGLVRDSLIEPDGKIVIAGSFTKVNGVLRRRIARLAPDGSLDTAFLNGLSGLEGPDPVSAQVLARQPDGRILVGGSFLGANGETRRGIARLNTNGSVDTSFFSNLNAATIQTPVNAIVVQPDGKIVIGGRFSSVDGLSRNNFARIHSNGSVDTTFLNTMSGSNGEVLAIASQPDGKLLVGGLFTSFNGQPKAFVTRILIDGGLDTGFTAGTNGSVWSLALQLNGQIFAAGEFTEVNGAPRGRLARLNSNGSTDSGFLNGQSGADGAVWEVSLQSDGRIVLGGNFNLFNGSQAGRIARLHTNGSVDTAFLNGTGANSGVYTVSIQSPRKIYAGGRFTSLSGLAQGGMARLSNVGYTPFDYDGDGKADVSVRRPADNVWHLLRATAGYTAQQFGEAGDRMTPSDYDADGKADVAVFRPSNGTWYIFMSQSQTFQAFSWGQNGDLPVPTDRDNDGRTDLVIFRPSNNTWYTRYSNGTFHTFEFGVAGDKPVVGDFDADGIGDIALFRPSNNNWYIIKSSLGFFIQTWGETADVPLTADFDGDGATDQAVFRPSTGQWYLSQTTAGFALYGWGQNGDVPVPADFDGDGRADIAIFRPSDGKWYIVNTTTGIQIQQFGQNGDVPTQSAFNY